MNVLVTGATGFLGSRLVTSYLGSGASVRAVARSRSGLGEDSRRSPAGLEFVQLDLCELGDGVNVLEGQDLVVHTAAKMHADRPDERRLQRRLHVEATRQLLEACRWHSVSRLVHVSTTAAIGISPDPTAPADETFRFNLDHLDLSYNRTKHEAEHLVLAADGPDLKTTVVNPGVMLGPYRNRYRGWEIIDRVLRRPVVVCTGGGLSLVHVDDVVDGIRRAEKTGKGGHRYVLSGENLSFRQIAKTVSDVAGKRRLVISVPDVVRDVLHAAVTRRRRSAALYLDRRYAYPYYSSTRARQDLGYEPRSFAMIVADALEHMAT